MTFRTRRFQSPAIFGAAAGGGGGGWATLIPQSGLVNAWPFDTANTTTSTGTDVIGGKNATFTAVTLNGSGPTTHLNNAAVFNGTTSRGDTTLASVPLSAFSLVMWVNSSSTGSGRVFANDTTATNNGINIQGTIGNVLLRLGNGTTSGLFGTGAITASTWTMLTFAYDGTNLKVYNNATLAGTTAFTGPVTAGSNNVGFGYNPAGSVDFWPGMIAGVAIYNRALTSGEVTTINGL